jgi:signal transduction histidine kinase
LRCDIRWTAEALANVIKNAAEHSPFGASISIEAGTNPLFSWIRVVDQGPGIAQDKMAKIFQRFEDSGGEHAGHGIGLPLSLAIMRRQGGDVEVDNLDDAQGLAVTFKFYEK